MSKHYEYTIFQKPLLAINQFSKSCNLSALFKLNISISEEEFYRFLIICVNHFPELKCIYNLDRITPIDIITDDFIKDKLTIKYNHNDDEIMWESQNKRLDISQGITFSACLVTNKVSSIIFTISHVIADGHTMYIIGRILDLFLNKSKFKLYLFLFAVKYGNYMKYKITENTKYLFKGFNLDFNLSHYNSLSYSTQLERVRTSSICIHLGNRKINNLGTQFSLASIQAMKKLYPDENYIKLRRPLGLRNKITGLNNLAFGEFHFTTSTIVDVSHNNPEEILADIRKGFSVKNNILNYCHSIKNSSDDICEYYSQIVANDYCTVSVSSFGVSKKEFFKNISLNGATVLACGGKPFFGLQVYIENQKLFCVVGYDSLITDTDMVIKFISHLCHIMKLDISDSYLKNCVI